MATEKRGQSAMRVRLCEQPVRLARGQSAMEFLMTYGWALLVVAVVIAVLFYLGVFRPQSGIPKSCTLPAGFSCYEFMLDNSGKLHLDMGQATGKTVTVTGIACSTNSSASLTPTSVSIRNGRHALITGSGVTCSGASSGTYRGKVIFTYTLSGSSITHTAEGDVSGPLENYTGVGGATPTPAPSPISGCGSTISSPGSYTIDDDLGPYAGTCITITSGGSNSTLNCGDHDVNGTGSGYGIYLNGASNVTVTGCNVFGFQMGIYLVSASLNDITGNTANGSVQGIRLSSTSSGNTVSGNTAGSNSDWAILIESGDNNGISGNTANSNTLGGISVSAGSNNSVTGNTANSNGNTGINGGGTNTTVTGNTANLNQYGISGISTDTTFTGNTACGTTTDIVCNPSGGPSIVPNTCDTTSFCSDLCGTGCP